MLINSDTTFRQFLPNAFSTAEGETSLFDKLQPFLLSSEQFVRDNLLDFNDSVGNDMLGNALATIIVDNALMTAIPSLDLVLTPNGFGIVSNSNVAPASKERVERLLDSLETNRDRNIQLALLHLPETAGWASTPQANLFAATLFPDLSLCDYLGITEHKWSEYLKWRAHLITIEEQLAHEYISPELYNAFRGEALHQFATTPTDRRFLIQTLRFHEIAILQGRTPHPRPSRTS